MYKRTKIVATIGPASEKKEIFKQLVEAGLSAARLNFSHGTHEEQGKRIAMIREVEKENNIFIPIIQDLQGPKIRLGMLEKSQMLEIGDKVNLIFGEQQTNEYIPVRFPIFPHLEKGHRIFINDGLVELKVLSSTKTTAECEVVFGGPISDHKGLNLPDTIIPYASFTEKDKNDLRYGLTQDIDFVAISFIQTAQEIEEFRKFIKSHTKRNVKIIVKVETASAIKHIEEIIEATDAIIIARGDLAIEIGQEEMPLVQRRLIKLARQHAKPVIVATQMLESMTVNMQPTRAEVNDVATAVLDEVDAVMLSAETAQGAHPLAAVSIMNRIIHRIERHTTQIAEDFHPSHVNNTNQQTTAIAAAANILAHQLHAEGIFCLTATGFTAMQISAYRPYVPIVVATSDVLVAHQLVLVYGTVPFYVADLSDYCNVFKNIISQYKPFESLQKNDKQDTIISVTGTLTGVAGNTDTIRVINL